MTNVLEFPMGYSNAQIEFLTECQKVLDENDYLELRDAIRDINHLPLVDDDIRLLAKLFADRF